MTPDLNLNPEFPAASGAQQPFPAEIHDVITNGNHPLSFYKLLISFLPFFARFLLFPSFLRRVFYPSLPKQTHFLSFSTQLILFPRRLPPCRPNFPILLMTSIRFMTCTDLIRVDFIQPAISLLSLSLLKASLLCYSLIIIFHDRYPPPAPHPYSYSLLSFSRG